MPRVHAVTEKRLATFTATIFIAGDIAQAKQVCREFCMTGLCVTVEPTSYIYTGGEEAGVRVGLINYPSFPADLVEIIARPSPGGPASRASVPAFLADRDAHRDDLEQYAGGPHPMTAPSRPRLVSILLAAGLGMTLAECTNDSLGAGR